MNTSASHGNSNPNAFCSIRPTSLSDWKASYNWHQVSEAIQVVSTDPNSELIRVEDISYIANGELPEVLWLDNQHIYYPAYTTTDEEIINVFTGEKSSWNEEEPLTEYSTFPAPDFSRTLTNNDLVTG
jgi:hypothetical protein